MNCSVIDSATALQVSLTEIRRVVLPTRDLPALASRGGTARANARLCQEAPVVAGTGILFEVASSQQRQSAVRSSLDYSC